MIKNYKNQIPPLTGRKYVIETDASDNSTITDVTEYIEEGTSFGANDIQGVCIIECTHTKSDTRHDLNTENVAVENIKFTATDNFNPGDTVYLNNVLMTVLNLTDNLVDCFKTGDVVFGFVKDNNLYLLTTGCDPIYLIRCNSPVESTDMPGFKYVQDYTVQGMTADYTLDAYIASGSHNGIWRVETATNKIRVWFMVTPSVNLYIGVAVHKSKGV